MTREEIIEHMKVMGQNAAKMDDVMMYVMTRKDCEVVMAAAELLAVQEPVKPEIAKAQEPDGHVSCWYVCGQCNMPIDTRDVYCRFCGRAVKWNE